MILKQDFYNNSSIDLAPALLGKLLCRHSDGKIIKFRITETEAYYSEHDTACHACKGKTERTKLLYEQGGLAYIYLCYGMHNIFNVVTGPAGFPQSVLIRGIQNFDGPGKLTKALKIDKSLNGENLVHSNLLWIEDDGYKTSYITSPRVGINYATAEYRDIHWRFIAEK